MSEALLLNERYELHAGIDVSDGLSIDLARLAAESGCGAMLDVSAIRHAGLGVAPPDAVQQALAGADLVTQTPGGQGVIRETIETILQAQGRWDELIQRYLV